MKALYIPLILLFILSCTQQQKEVTDETRDESPKELAFTEIKVSDSAQLWWARDFVDVDGDGLLDVALINNNGSGGWMGYLKSNDQGLPWETIIVAEMSPNGLPFASGDLEVDDLDNDGDIDLIGVEHPGEWSDADADATLFWYEQTEDGWVPRKIGVIPSALKDMSIADLNGDLVPEIITATYNAEVLSVFTRKEGGEFTEAWNLLIDNLHEGMDIGDLDGDGDQDIATNGYWLPNPGVLEGPWAVETIDEQWYNQEEDHWSRNATKNACFDVDNDGKDEVFISHSEKAGYPIARYDFEDGNWERTIVVEEVAAAHSLQIVDLDMDGQYEIATGVNRNRMRDISKELEIDEPSIFPVMYLKWEENSWVETRISEKGVYNLLAGDFEGDGDIDFIRLTSHDEKDMWLVKNEWN